MGLSLPKAPSIYPYQTDSAKYGGLVLHPPAHIGTHLYFQNKVFDTDREMCVLCVCYEEVSIVSISPKQKRAVAAIQAHLDETGFAPTYEELAERCGVTKSTVRQYLRALEKKGVVRREHYGHRSIEIIENADERKLPVVGRVAAGTPILAVENIEDRVDINEFFTGRADFLLRVEGDSMTGAGILDNDLVAVRIQPEVAPGKIAVVMVNEEATVKRIFVRGRKVILVAENAAYEPMELDAATNEVRIVGCVVGVIRKM